MSKASQVILLCEDKAHEVFVRRFLRTGWSVKPRTIRLIPYPKGEGSGKQHVEDKIAKEVKAYRSRSALTILLIVRDADEDSLEKVAKIIDGKLDTPRKNDENIAYIIPKWHIETWVAYLDGVEVDESDKRTYKNKYKSSPSAKFTKSNAKSKEIFSKIDDLSKACREKKELPCPPPSLVSACKEFERIRETLS